MSDDEYSGIWHDTIGQTLHITETSSQITTGMSDDVAAAYEQSAGLTDDQIWEHLQAGTL